MSQVGLLGYTSIYSILKETAKLFSRVTVLFYIPTSSVGEIQFLYILASIWHCHYFYFSYFNRCAVVSHCDLNLHFPLVSEAEHFLMNRCAIYISSSVKCFLSFVHVLIGLFMFLLLNFESSLDILDMSPFSDK